MKLLTATSLGSSVSDDFTFASEGEVIFPALPCGMPSRHSGELAGGPCGCSRAWSGATSGEPTTKMMIRDVAVTETAVTEQVEAMFIRCGFGAELDDAAFDALIRQNVRTNRTIADRFEVGTIVRVTAHDGRFAASRVQ